MATQHAMSSSVDTSSRVRFTFAQDGIGPPVFLAGSFTENPWEPQEMKHQKREQMDAHDHEEYDFSLETDVPQGQWQYKFRVGKGNWWMLDEDAETVTDDVGNQNSLLNVAAKHSDEKDNHLTALPTDPESVRTSMPESAVEEDKTGTLADPAIETPQQLLEVLKEKLDRIPSPAEETGRNQPKALSPKLEPLPQITEEIPLPFTVIEKAPDVEPAVYGDLTEERVPLEEDQEKRMADAEPDQVIESSSSSDSGSTAVSEAGDLHFGEDFGPSATPAQKLARERRASDALPDKVILVSESQPPAELVPHEDVNEVIPGSGRRSSDDVDLSGLVDGDNEVTATQESSSADVAAEVADTAAIMDPEELDEGTGAFAAACGYAPPTESPRIEYCPLFAHESFQAPVVEASHRPKKRSHLHVESRRSSDESESTLEEFPLDLVSIYERIKTTELELEADQTLDDGHIQSPVLGKSDSVSVRTRSISPLDDNSPSLNSIPEEDDTPLSSQESLSLPEVDAKAGDVVDGEMNRNATDGLRSSSDDSTATTATGLVQPVTIRVESADDETEAGMAESDLTLDGSVPTALRQPTKVANQPDGTVSKPSTTAVQSTPWDTQPTILQLIWRTVFLGWLGTLFHTLLGHRSGKVEL